LTTDQVRAMVCRLPESPRGLRDRALLLIGFAGGFRRSELAALDFADVEDSEDGLKILIRRSKADQEGEGRKLGIPFGSDPRTCPVRAYGKVDRGRRDHRRADFSPLPQPEDGRLRDHGAGGGVDRETSCGTRRPRSHWA
jgi:integrase